MGGLAGVGGFGGFGVVGVLWGKWELGVLGFWEVGSWRCEGFAVLGSAGGVGSCDGLGCARV